MGIGNRPFISDRGVWWIRHNFGAGTQRTWFSSRTCYLLAVWASHFICLRLPFSFCKITILVNLCGLFQHCFCENTFEIGATAKGYLSCALRFATQGGWEKLPGDPEQGSCKARLNFTSLLKVSQCWMSLALACLTLLFKRQTPDLLFVTAKSSFCLRSVYSESP